MTEVVVKELSPSLRDDFLLFFDHVAFADNPDWSDCYCSAYHFANNKGKAESRHQASLLIEDDRLHGFLAYDNGTPVGLCNAASRGLYPVLHWLFGPGPDKGQRVVSVVGFVVAASIRHQGGSSRSENRSPTRSKFLSGMDSRTRLLRLRPTCGDSG